MAGPLGSADITPLHSYYGPGRHLLVFGRFPGVAGYTAYLAPAISPRDEEGFSSSSVCPCHRAVAFTPPRWDAASVRFRHPILPSPYGSGLGPRILTYRGHNAFTLLRPGNSWSPQRRSLSMGFRILVSLHPAIQTTGLLTLAPAGLSPAEHTSLYWTHSRTARFPGSGLKPWLSSEGLPRFGEV